MTTKDLVADFGGVGDGQRITATASISGNTLTPASNFFATHGGNPTGKLIFINASGLQFPASSGIDSFNFVTITGYNSSTGAVTLDQSCSVTKTIVSMDIVWGTDNSDAFVGATGSWRAYAQPLGVTQAHMTFPDGMYCISGKQQFSPNKGVLNALWTGISGNAVACILTPLFPAELQVGGDVPIPFHGLTDPAGTSARLQTANAGATTVTLVDAATYGGRIVAGRKCIIAALDRQSVFNGAFGYPPNPHFFEHNVITGYSGGVVTLQNPLANTYKSTYTQWDPGDGGHPDQGGPATIYVIAADYPDTVEINDISIYSPYNQIACHASNVILRRDIFDGEGLYPTQNETYLSDTSVYARELEMDKIDGEVTFNDCTLRSLNFQSGSPNLVTINRGTIAIMIGTPTELVMNDVSFVDEGAIRFGAAAYGYTRRVTLNNCSGIKLVQRGGASVSSGDLGMDVSSFYSMSGGVLSFPLFLNQLNPRFLVPGAWIFFDDKYLDQVVDTWDDGTNCYVSFKKLTGGWPFTPVHALTVHPCLDLTVRGCSGSPAIVDLNGAPARTPLYSYSKRTYDGASNAFPPNSGPAEEGPTLFGLLKSLKINVSTAYSGANGNLQFQPTGQFIYTVVDPTTFAGSSYLPAVKLNTPANRIIAPGNVQNAQSGDSGLDPGSAWMLALTDPFMSGDIRGETFPPSVRPTYSIEWITDQGIPPAVPLAVMPLRFRMHS